MMGSESIRIDDNMTVRRCGYLSAAIKASNAVGMYRGYCFFEDGRR